MKLELLAILQFDCFDWARRCCAFCLQGSAPSDETRKKRRSNDATSRDEIQQKRILLFYSCANLNGASTAAAAARLFQSLARRLICMTSVVLYSN